MNKYRLRFAMPVFFEVDVEAESEQDAIDKAGDHAYLNIYGGNARQVGNMVGVSDENIGLEPGDCIIENDDFDITAEKIE